MNPTISEFQETVRDWSQRKGWYETEVSVPESLMLMVSEISEAMEEYRSGCESRFVYFHSLGTGRGAVQTQVPSVAMPYAESGRKPEGIAVELADAVIRIFDFFGRHDISLSDILEVKMAYNETRPHRHGGKVA